MFATMRKPKWLALLAGVLLVVIGFGWLGWWQLTSAFSSALPPEDAEAYVTAVPMGELIQPGEGLIESSAGRPVEATGWVDARDLVTVSGRLQDGETGWWVVGRLVVAEAGTGDLAAPNSEDAQGATVAAALPSIPVAIGWAASEEAAAAAIADLSDRIPELPAAAEHRDTTGAHELRGQLQPGQDPVVSRDRVDPQVIGSMAPGQLINMWQEPSPGYYSAYLVLDGGLPSSEGGMPEGLEIINIVPVDQSFQLNLLNIFYAIEWAIFIVMAFYIWWRLVRDDYLATQAADAGVSERLAAEIRREKLREIAARRGPNVAAETSASEEKK